MFGFLDPQLLAQLTQPYTPAPVAPLPGGAPSQALTPPAPQPRPMAGALSPGGQQMPPWLSGVLQSASLDPRLAGFLRQRFQSGYGAMGGNGGGLGPQAGRAGF